MSLGAGETTLMRLTTAYAMIVNGGKKITPIIIVNKIDLNINSYFSSILWILGTIAIIPLGILNPTIEVNREEENNTWDQKPISL